MNKRLFLLLLHLLMVSVLTAQTSSENCVHIRKYLSSDSSRRYLTLDCGEVSLWGSTSASSYYFDLKDYQGNVRMAVRSDTSSPFVTDYYPYGGVIRKGKTGTHHRLFIGKELDKMHALNWYDFGARMYDPSLGRFTTMDPLCEKYYSISPYAYCANNPVNAVDPDGKRVIVQYKNDINKYDYYIFSGFNNTMSSIPNNSFVKDFILAYLYNTKNGGGDCMKSAVYDSNNDYYVIDAMDSNLSDSPSTSFHSQDGKAIITWESRRGLETTDGGRQSAATRLEHEFDHAVDNAKNGTKHRERRNTYNEDYSNEEEKRVILGAEKKTAENNNESIRTNHGGFVFDTRNSISIKPL
ncbi:RHS repeat-associated core domain-containing protein [Xylanibacter brevis]|uniref:RHS repeat-associated core domain-containing protein n=1 Tax=Xylanibacter brevis TaxID=83231 RepID=UPI00048A0C3A|nr:RHS repeat-associated core domain-containing protein [Xylanibacter brevis]